MQTVKSAQSAYSSLTVPTIASVSTAISTARILTACYGYAGWIPVADNRDYTDMIQRGCTVLDDDGNLASNSTPSNKLTKPQAQTPTRMVVAGLCGISMIQASTIPLHMDGMPMTF